MSLHHLDVPFLGVVASIALPGLSQAPMFPTAARTVLQVGHDPALRILMVRGSGLKIAVVQEANPPDQLVELGEQVLGELSPP